VGNSLAEALRLLHAAAEDGRLEAIAHARELTLVTAFGDNAIGVMPQRGTALDLPNVINDFALLTHSDDFALLDLGQAAPVDRERALTGGEELYESAARGLRRGAATSDDGTPGHRLAP
jgi:hypothetical protein